MRVWAVKGMKLAFSGAISRPRMPYFSLASTTIERPSGVSSDSEASCAASARSRSVTPGDGQKLGRLAVAERDRAGLVEQQRVDVARRLDRAAGHGEHVEPHQPVHAGDADGREQARRSWSGSTSRTAPPGSAPASCRRHRRRSSGWSRRRTEDDGHAGEQDVERDLVRRLLPLGAFDQGDHAVEEGRARLAAVIRTLIQSEITCVPPVTADRSPPLSRITGADSPVIAASSTEATPSMTSPSPGSCRRPPPARRRRA